MDIDLAGGRADRRAARRAGRAPRLPDPDRDDDRPRARARRGRLRDRHVPGRRGRGRTRPTSRSRDRYGVDQRSATRSGPGGVFRFLRSMPGLRDDRRGHGRALPARAADQLLQPDGDELLVPRASSGSRRSGSATPSRAPRGMLARHLERAVRGGRASACAGINHQAWFLSSAAGRDRPLPAPARGDDERPTCRAARCCAADDRASTPTRPRRSIYEGAAGRAGPHRADARLRLLPYRVEPPRLRVRALLPQDAASWSSEFIRRRWDYYEICAAPRRGGYDERAAGAG